MSKSEEIKNNAKNFHATAAKLRRRNESQSVASAPSASEERGSASEFLDNAQELHANTYTKSRIIPEIDELVNNHMDGKPISKNELEATFKKIMSNMVEDGVISQDEMKSYVAPRQTGGIIGFNKKIKESQFHEDLNNSVQFNDKGTLDAPNLNSLKDKIMHCLSKICSNLGLSSLEKSCRQAISAGNQDKMNTIENSAVSMTKKIAQQVKLTGNKTPEKSSIKQRVGRQTENIIAERQNKGSGRAR